MLSARMQRILMYYALVKLLTEPPRVERISAGGGGKAISSLSQLGVKDHDLLDGLLDDDHTQYLPLTGIRAMTGSIFFDANNIYNIGSSSHRLKNIYSYGIAKWNYMGAGGNAAIHTADDKYISFVSDLTTGDQIVAKMWQGWLDILRAGDIAMLDQKMMTFGTYTDAQRPAAGTAGRWIFNTDDGMPNYDDGTNWRDINGNIT